MSETYLDEMEVEIEVEADESETSSASLAYIKVIDLEEARAIGTVVPSDIALLPNVKLYALRTADGMAIAVTDSRATAYGAAVRNNLVPLSVH